MLFGKGMSSGRAALLFAGLIVAVTLVAYIPALTGGFVWDDDAWVTENEALRTISGLGTIWLEPGELIQYYPLTFTSWWMDYHLFGLNPFGYHLGNVLLHALCAILLWRVLLLLGVGGAWLAALIFALHPIHVESVAWITERKNVLSGAFYLSSLLVYLRFLGIGPDRADGEERTDGRRWPWYGFALALFACALLSKTVTFTLPAAIVLILWWKGRDLSSRNFLPLVPMFVLGIFMGSVTAWQEKYGLGVAGPEWELTFVGKVLAAGRIFWFYLGKLIWPSGLSFSYPRWQVDGSTWWQYLYPAAFLMLVTSLWIIRRRIGRGPLAAALFYTCTLVPALGFFTVYYMRYSYVADHFVYLASIGPIVLAAALVSQATTPSAEQPAGVGETPARGALRNERLLFFSIATVLLALLATLTWRQGRMYESAESLWRDSLAKHPSATLANYNLGVLLEERGRQEEAMELYRTAAEAHPHFREPRTNLGIMLLRTGRAEEAVPYLEEAARISPDFFTTRSNLGSALAEVGRLEEAAEQLEEALRLKPDVATTLVNLGRIRTALGEHELAVGHFREAVRIDSAWDDAVAFLGGALVRGGRLDEAVDVYRSALEGRPGNASLHATIGDLLRQLGRHTEAGEAYREALRIDPGSARALKGLEAAPPGEEGEGETLRDK